MSWPAEWCHSIESTAPGPGVTVAATIGPEARNRIREVADRNGVAVARIVALIVDDELGTFAKKV